MFVYQDKEGNICVTFEDNKPVKEPEYVIAIDQKKKALYALIGTIESPPEVADEEDTPDEAAVEPEEIVEDPEETTEEE